ncbi:iron-containing alcohol dehydrogenase [Plautia stali symbiont]|nr:iron-containing alcohol dehydrogenase [Plautia stali symbiont]
MLFPFLDVLAESAHPEQQRLMAALAERLLPDETTPPALALKA